MNFANFEKSTSVRIDSLLGELVNEVQLTNGNGTWDLRNRKERQVVSGLYYAKFNKDKKIRKITVQK